MTSDDGGIGALTLPHMGLVENTWRGHPHWECEEHGFTTLKADAAVEHLAELHADEVEKATGITALTEPAPDPVKTATAPAPAPDKKGGSR